MPLNRDDEIFSEALDLPVDQRAAFLDRACAGDPAQRTRSDALLAAGAGGALVQALKAEALALKKVGSARSISSLRWTKSMVERVHACGALIH